VAGSSKVPAAAEARWATEAPLASAASVKGHYLLNLPADTNHANPHNLNVADSARLAVLVENIEVLDSYWDPLYWRSAFIGTLS
jgi:hypothetical protein